MPGPLPQLTLDLFKPTHHDFATYHAGPNAETVAALRDWTAGRGPRVLFIWGAPATGKSHLLQAALGEAAALGRRTMYVPLAHVIESGPGLLDGLEAVNQLAIDDLEACHGRADWEQQLFHLFNALSADNGRLLWASRRSPASGIFILKDLSSRLAASLVYHLDELTDDDKKAALADKARGRGLRLSLAVMEFIMQRERRDMSALEDILDELDSASLRDGRALTLPFVREILAARHTSTGSGKPADDDP